MIDNIKIIINTRNRRTKFINLNTIHIRNCIKTMKYIILLNLFNNIFMNNKIYVIEYKSYNITLKIKGIGIKQIFSSDSFFQSKYYPNEIYINGYNQSNVTHSYYLNQIDNIIELVWYNLIDDCQQMFQYCYDITEIDLSNFNTSNVTSMSHMFHSCSSLTSLNLSNFDTSKVTSMSHMFKNCSSLTFLNLSNFNTSKVGWMEEMFYNCINLEYIICKN